MINLSIVSNFYISTDLVDPGPCARGPIVGSGWTQSLDSIAFKMKAAN